MMIVFFGANDASLEIAPQSVALQEYENNLRLIIQDIKYVSCAFAIPWGPNDLLKHRPRMPVILMTPPPVHEEGLKVLELQTTRVHYKILLFI
jgi:hypothetical protein